MEVQRELSEIIRSGIKDPRIHPMTSVVAVEVTPDLKYCKAYISVLGDEEAAKATVEGLRSASSYVRRELARRVNLRNTPELKFILDQSIEYGVNILGRAVRQADEGNHRHHEEYDGSGTDAGANRIGRYFRPCKAGRRLSGFDSGTLSLHSDQLSGHPGSGISGRKLTEVWISRRL